MANHRKAMASAWRTSIIAASLLAAGLCASAQPLPVELRLAELEYSKGNAARAKSLAAEYTSKAEGRAWAATAEYLDVKALLDNGDRAAFATRLAEIERSNPAHPKLAALLTLQAEDLAKQNKNKEAERVYKDILSKSALSAKDKSQARLDLLDLYWKKKDFKDADFLRAIDELPDNRAIDDGGETDYRVGLVKLRQNADAEGAKAAFEAAAARAGDHAADARDSARWMNALVSAKNTDATADAVKQSFADLVRSTQGGQSRTINPVLTGWYTLKYARAIRATEPAAAQSLALAIAADPVFGKWSAHAAAQAAEWSGGDVAAANARKADADAADTAMKDALAAAKDGRHDEALAKFDALVAAHPQSAAARDARLRKGYTLIRAQRKEEAAAAFESALAANADLGPSHPFNLEATARLHNVRHGMFYDMKSSPTDSARRHPENAPALDVVFDLNQQWREAISPDSPDFEQALLEQAGLLLEQAATFNTKPERWEQIRTFVKETILDDPKVSKQTKAVAEMFVIETYSEEDRFQKVIDASDGFEQRYPGCWREIGTVWTLAALSHSMLRDGDAYEKCLYRFLDEMPSDAPTFKSFDYHLIYLGCLRDIEAKKSNSERSEQMDFLYKDRKKSKASSGL